MKNLSIFHCALLKTLQLRKPLNIMIDSPRYSSKLANRLSEMGGVHLMVLSHLDSGFRCLLSIYAPENYHFQMEVIHHEWVDVWLLLKLQIFQLVMLVNSGVYIHLKGSIYFMSFFCRIDSTVFCMSKSYFEVDLAYVCFMTPWTQRPALVEFRRGIRQ